MAYKYVNIGILLFLLQTYRFAKKPRWYLTSCSGLWCGACL